MLILVQLGMNGCFGCWEHERAALLQLKASINSTADIDFFRTWNSSTNKKSDCCDWEGVKCDNTMGRVIQLDLNYTIGWSGEDWCLNASLFLPFEELQYLDLFGDQISRWVPNEDMFISQEKSIASVCRNYVLLLPYIFLFEFSKNEKLVVA